MSAFQSEPPPGIAGMMQRGLDESKRQTYEKLLHRPQTDREIAEMIARFRTPPGFSWQPLADDIETVLKIRRPAPSPRD